MTRSRVAVGDGVRYAVHAEGHGPAVLMLHGFTGSGADWNPFLPALLRVAMVMTVDLLGHGGSDAPRDPARHAVERQAADIASILRRQGVDGAHVVGYSFGARIALRLAIDAPGSVRSMCLESPSAGIVDAATRAARREADESLAGTLETEGIEAFVDRWEALPLFAPERHRPAAARRATRAARLRNDPMGLAASLRGAGHGAMPPLWGALERIDRPVSVLAGARDATGLERASAVAAAIPGARLEVVEGVGHAPHREAPAVFARILAGHLVRCSSTCSPASDCLIPALPPPVTSRSSP